MSCQDVSKLSFSEERKKCKTRCPSQLTGFGDLEKKRYDLEKGLNEKDEKNERRRVLDDAKERR